MGQEDATLSVAKNHALQIGQQPRLVHVELVRPGGAARPDEQNAVPYGLRPAGPRALGAHHSLPVGKRQALSYSCGAVHAADCADERA